MSMKKVLEIAQSWVGYLEKASNKDLDSKTANAGTANWTIFGKWYGLNPAEWCDMFVSYCAEKGGEAAAVGKYAYCPSHVNFFKGRGQWFNRGAKVPQAGDVIFFGDADHVGLVESVSGGYVHTIEGNTRSGSTLVVNGGGVFRKQYPLTSSYIMGYGRPAYSESGTSSSTSGGTTTKELMVYSQWKTYKNGSTDEPVYADTDLTEKTGSLNPYESCYCDGRFGGAYHIYYKKDGYVNTWKTGYVGYNGGVKD